MSMTHFREGFSSRPSVVDLNSVSGVSASDGIIGCWFVCDGIMINYREALAVENVRVSGLPVPAFLSVTPRAAVHS